MSRKPPDLGALRLDDSDPEDLFDSPEQHTRQGTTANGSAADPTPSRNQQSRYSNEEAREEALRKELESVRGINKVIEDVVSSLQKTRDNMDVRQTPTDMVLFKLRLS